MFLVIDENMRLCLYIGSFNYWAWIGVAKDSKKYLEWDRVDLSMGSDSYTSHWPTSSAEG